MKKDLRHKQACTSFKDFIFSPYSFRFPCELQFIPPRSTDKPMKKPDRQDGRKAGLLRLSSYIYPLNSQLQALDL